LETLDLTTREYGVITLHRPSNVDDDETLRGLLGALAEVSRDIDLVFPVHPRTRNKLNGFQTRDRGLKLLAPQGYSDFMALLANARVVLTDSGGIQEEAVVLGVPCLTLRENTERPITVDSGINELVGTDPNAIVDAARRRLSSPMPEAYRPPLWDGQAAERIVDALEGPTPAWPHNEQSRIALEEAMP
jgi:UDP-N-acetylglucosamine 2-epimerase (non-hydrolysing)